MALKTTALTEFERGNYAKLIETLEHRSRKPSAADLAAQIGAYSFLGRIEEALELWKLRGVALPRDLRARARFFLGVALTRTYRYREGRALFDENLKAAKTSPYTWQGAGFYAYFTGDFIEAKNLASKALKAAIAAQDGYAKFLAVDLLGHCHVQMGSRSEGLRLIAGAKDQALEHGNRNFASAFDTAKLIYEAEAGWRAETIASELEAALAESRTDDSYTRNGLVLELARQWTLRGRWRETRELLDRNASAIYAYGNRRHEVTLLLRLSELALRQGDRHSAEHFVQSARRCLKEIADSAFEARVSGLERKLGRPVASAGSSLIDRQIRFRQSGGEDPGTSATEDPIHHLFRLGLRDGKSAAQAALASGLLGLWPQFQALPAGKRTFTVLDDGRSFVMTDPSGVSYRKDGLSLQSLRLLRSLAGEPADKEKIIRDVWRYPYSPLRHDALIYSSLTKLRHLLAPHANWIVMSDEGWRLDPEVSWQLPGEARAETPRLPAVRETKQEILNFRQQRALRFPPEVIWSVQSYKTDLKVSTMTAYRDLQDLLNRGFLLRSGRGRNTRYQRKTPPVTV